MRESLSTCPWHCKHDVHWYSQRLRAVNVGEAGRVRDDGVCDKGNICDWIRQQARIPEPIQHVGHHGTFAADLAFHDRFERRQQAGVPDHVGHESSRISAYWVEFEASSSHKVCEDIMRCDPDPVSMLLQFVPQSQERLDIASTSDHLDDYI